MSIEIRDVRAICTAPEGINLVAVKIETNEPELYGVGCATFAHRYIRIEDAQEKFVDIKILDSKYSLDRVRGDIQDVTFRNITVGGSIFPVSIIRGFEMHNEMHRPRHIRFENVVVHGALMLVLSIGNLMTGGFDQIFNLSNPAVEDICEILDMYIYRITFGSVPDFGFSMAISLFRSVVNCIFLIAADRGAKKFGGSGLFG